MKVKKIVTNKELNRYINEHPDEGCPLGAKCEDCPYVSGSVEFTSKCYLEYPNGREGLADEERASMMYNRFRMGASIPILAKIFNMTIESTQRVVARYYNRLKEKIDE